MLKPDLGRNLLHSTVVNGTDEQRAQDGCKCSKNPTQYPRESHTSTTIVVNYSYINKRSLLLEYLSSPIRVKQNGCYLKSALIRHIVATLTRSIIVQISSLLPCERKFASKIVRTCKNWRLCKHFLISSRIKAERVNVIAVINISSLDINNYCCSNVHTKRNCCQWLFKLERLQLGAKISPRLVGIRSTEK